MYTDASKKGFGINIQGHASKGELPESIEHINEKELWTLSKALKDNSDTLQHRSRKPGNRELGSQAQISSLGTIRPVWTKITLFLGNISEKKGLEANVPRVWA